MAVYVMFQFFTGHCRMEKVTRSRPVETVQAELLEKWGSRGYMKVVRDVTDAEDLQAGPAFYHGRGSGSMEESPDGYSGGSRSSRFL